MWNTIKKFFRESETLAFARLQMLVGFVAGVITYVDPQLVASVIPGGWLPWWLLISGIATEYLRRRRADDL